MRIAVLADVHANLPALEAVAADMRTEGVEGLWHLGDAVGYGADPLTCLQLLADLGAELIGQLPGPLSLVRVVEHDEALLAVGEGRQVVVDLGHGLLPSRRSVRQHIQSRPGGGSRRDARAQGSS